MIGPYLRLRRRCQTVNQLNRLHIALENRLLPLQLQSLHKVLQSVGPDALGWTERLLAMARRSGKARPEPYERACLRPSLTLYRSAGEAGGARMLLICWTGAARRMMMPLPVFLQHLDAATVDVLLLRYPLGEGYRRGVPDLGPDIASTIDRVAQHVVPGRYARVAAMGVSGGGLPALLTGLRLGLDTVLAVGAGHPADPRWTEALGQEAEALLARWAGQARRLPRITLAHGADSPADTAAARALAELLPAQRMAVSSDQGPVGHVALAPLLEQGRLRGFLEQALSLTQGAHADVAPGV